MTHIDLHTSHYPYVILVISVFELFYVSYVKQHHVPSSHSMYLLMNV